MTEPPQRANTPPVKGKRFSLRRALLLLGALLITGFAQANPIAITPTPWGQLTGGQAALIVWLFPLAVVIEYLVVLALLRPGRIAVALLAVLLVNLLTYPLTLLCSVFIGAAAEILPILGEWGLYVLIFGGLHRRLRLARRAGVSACLAASLVANLISFGVGALAVEVHHPPVPSNLRGRRVMSDLRSMATGLDSYAIDHGLYPTRVDQLTTPLAHLTRILTDPFTGGDSPESAEPYWLLAQGGPEEGGFVVWSAGPDEDHDLTSRFLLALLSSAEAQSVRFEDLIRLHSYEPTNGTLSDGDVCLLGGSWRTESP